jgi:hypothetical protein
MTKLAPSELVESQGGYPASVPSLTAKAKIVDIAHGTIAPGDVPVMLLILDFHFLGSGDKRRFRHVEIELHFANDPQRSKNEPEVTHIVPNGSFELNKTMDAEAGANSAV